MTSTPKHVHSKGIRKRSSLGRSFKSPLAQHFKSPLASTQTHEHESPQSVKAEIVSLREKLAENEREIKSLTEQRYDEKELQTHIEKLHEYNEIKDTGQMVLGRIADVEGVRTKDLYERYGLEMED